jgi:hypothetical protein
MFLLLRSPGSSLTSYSGENGRATSAGLDLVQGVCGDSAGSVYLSESNRIRRVDSSGIISTYAGTGVSSSSGTGNGGKATSATFITPQTCTVDSNADLYFVIYDNENAVRKVVSSTTLISRYAGNASGSFGSSGDGGKASSATFKNANSIYVDTASNLFIAEYQGNKIRKVSASSGIISTFAGTGVDSMTGQGGRATSATFAGYPIVVTGDYLGNIFIGASNRIHRVDISTTYMIIAAGKLQIHVVLLSYTDM